MCVVAIKVVVVNSNGTSFDYVSAVPIENGPVSLDIYSTPQYKVNQPVECEGDVPWKHIHRYVWTETPNKTIKLLTVYPGLS